MKLITKRGALTSYAYACGYVKTAETKTGIKITLDQTHGIFNLRAFPAGSHRIWQTFRTLKEAQKGFSELKKELENFCGFR